MKMIRKEVSAGKLSVFNSKDIKVREKISRSKYDRGKDQFLLRLSVCARVSIFCLRSLRKRIIFKYEEKLKSP